jgi:hypothetical protein
MSLITLIANYFAVWIMKNKLYDKLKFVKNSKGAFYFETIYREYCIQL